MTDKNRRIISLLLRAKAAGDTRTWDRKAGLSREAIRSAPGDFEEDSRSGHIVGMTHTPTGFRFHLPEDQLRSVRINKEQNMNTSMKAGCFSVYKQAGLPKELWEPMFEAAVKQAGLKDVATNVWGKVKQFGKFMAGNPAEFGPDKAERSGMAKALAKKGPAPSNVSTNKPVAKAK